MNIAILGAGVGGLATAIALTQQGFDVRIYERQASLSTIGAGIVCWPNATFVLKELGVLDETAAVSGAITRMVRTSSDGQALGALNVGQINTLMGYPSLSMLRKDLMRILERRLATLGVRVHYGHRVVDISGGDSGATTIQFDKLPAIEPDVVIGADGRMNSVARRFVHGDNTPVYQGFINWIGVFESPVSMFPDTDVFDYWGVGTRFGIVSVTDKVAYWAGGVAEPQVGKNDPAAYKQDLAALFSGWNDKIAMLIEQTPVEHINKVYVHDHNPIDRWHRDNVLLIGDAAHAALPTSGQGACQALEDAWHLARLLKQGGNLASVFSSFTALRTAKTHAIGNAGRQLATALFNTDPDYCQQRNQNSIDNDFDASAHGMAQLWGSHLVYTAWAREALHSDLPT